MRGNRMALWTIAVLLGGVPTLALAQNQGNVAYGMFGPRTFGQTLRPQTLRYDSGIVTSSVGSFLGIGGGRAMMFNGLPWQYPAPPQAALNPVQFAQLQQNAILQSAMNQAALNQAALNQAAVLNAQTPAIRPPAPVTPGGGTTAPPTSPQAPDQWLRTMPGAATGVPGITPGANPAATVRPMAPPIQVGFNTVPPAVNPAATAARVLNVAGGLQKLSPITVTLDSGTAVLRGQVATEHDRLLAQSLAMLQPGIYAVRNELTVAGAAVGPASTIER